VNLDPLQGEKGAGPAWEATHVRRRGTTMTWGALPPLSSRDRLILQITKGMGRPNRAGVQIGMPNPRQVETADQGEMDPGGETEHGINLSRSAANRGPLRSDSSPPGTNPIFFTKRMLDARIVIAAGRNAGPTSPASGKDRPLGSKPASARHGMLPPRRSGPSRTDWGYNCSRW
jgi:hypothetical protein